MIVTLAFAVAARAQAPGPNDMVNNPPFASWSSFKPGAKVTQKETVTLAGGGKVEVQTTLELVEKTKDHVVVEATYKQSTPSGVEQTVERTTFPAKVKRSDIDTPDEQVAVTEGKEQVEFKGKKIDTEWVEATSKTGDQTWTEKIWTAREVPGGIVKQTLMRKQGDKVLSESMIQVVETK
jgi:hypothetical protein